MTADHLGIWIPWPVAVSQTTVSLSEPSFNHALYLWSIQLFWIAWRLVIDIWYFELEVSLPFLKIWEKYQTAGHLVILKPWQAAGHLDSNKIYFRVVCIESRLQLRWFRRHCKFHLNFKSCTHQIEWIFLQESLEKIHNKFKELAEKAWPSSWSDAVMVDSELDFNGS